MTTASHDPGPESQSDDSDETKEDDSSESSVDLVPFDDWGGGLGEPSSEVEDLARSEERDELAERLVDRGTNTSMLSKFGWVVRLIARFLFAHVLFETRSVANIRDAGQRGTVVYVLQSRSLLDYLYFNWAFLKHDLPLARFSNGPKTTLVRGFFAWLGSLFRRQPAKPEEQMQALVQSGEAVFLFLEKPKSTEDENLELSQKYLYRLIRAQRATPDPIYVVPLLLVWERRPDQKQRTIIEDIFGTTQNPGFFRKSLFWFQAVWQSFLRFGTPLVQVSTAIELHQFVQEYPGADTADASELLRERLLEYLERERRVILGPTGEASKSLWKEVKERPEIQDAIRRVARTEGEDEETIAQRAKDQFEEIAAEPNLLVLKILSALLSLIWYRIYSGFEVDEEGLDRVREAARDSSIVLIPSHKSHVDYLIISYLFYQYGLNPPAIAAGVNLAFWPMGWIFRRCGAFFIRRSFRGEELYPIVFKEYLIRIMEEGYPVEFFIEGTRSRTGKLIKPKYGMLDMIVRAYASGRLEDVKLVPISVGYEKVIEEGAHKHELLGGEKEKESLSGLLKTPKFLTSRYGRLYVEFDEPVSVGEYFEKYDVDRLAPEEEALDAMVVRLAHRIIYDINQVTTVTPAALAAMVLLTNDARGIDRLRFQREVGFLILCLKQPGRDARLSRSIRDGLASRESAIVDAVAKRRVGKPVVEVPDGDPEVETVPVIAPEVEPDVESLMGDALGSVLDEALKLFEKNDQVTVRTSDGETIYQVPDEARVELNYYRNSILHHFVPEALLAAAIGRCGPGEITLDEVMKQTLFLSRMFKYEWIYEERAEFENVFMRTLRYFEACGWLSRDGEGGVEVAEPRPAELEFFRRNVLTYLEGYALVAKSLGRLDEKVQRDEFVSELLKQAKSDYLKGHLIYQESLSKPTYQNALRLFNDWGIVERSFEGSKKKEHLELSEEWRDEERRDELFERVSSFVVR